MSNTGAGNRTRSRKVRRAAYSSGSPKMCRYTSCCIYAERSRRMVPYSRKGMSRRGASRDEPANPRRKSSDRISPAGSSSRPSAVETGNRSVRSCMGDPPKCREKSRSDPEGISPLPMHPIFYLTIMERTSLYKKNPSPSLPSVRGRPERLAGSRKRKDGCFGAGRKNRSLRTDGVRKGGPDKRPPLGLPGPPRCGVTNRYAGRCNVTAYQCVRASDRRRGGPLHGRGAQCGEMAHGQRGRVMAYKARKTYFIHVPIVFSGNEAVVLRRTEGVAGSALDIDIDRPRPPVGRRRCAVAAHVGPGEGGIVEGRRSGFGNVRDPERRVPRRHPERVFPRPGVGPVVMRLGPGTQPDVTGVAGDGGQGVVKPEMDGVRPRDVRVRRSRRRFRVAGGAPGGERVVERGPRHAGVGRERNGVGNRPVGVA